MTDVPSRELRNNASGLLRRVEGGERLRVTVNGRPVAELGPLPSRARTMRWEAFAAARARQAPDPGLAEDLAEALPDTTDDVDPR
ncbi:MAG: type II toxin-antitoxin system Phd/YefM family antitoxin [Egibacteraceae bacterium]